MRFHELPTPVYVIDEARLKANLERLNALERRTGCRVLLAQKAFSAFALYPLIGRYISGTAASGLYEARLGFEEMGKENHVYSPAYTAAEIDALRTLCSHIIFNSIRQFETFYPRLSGVSAGLRINPQHSTQSGAIYDPCAPYSRLGITRAHFPDALPAGVEGFHMHTLCEQDADALVETFEVLERDFGRYFRALKWLNLGGGHHITRPGYDIDALEGLIGYIRSEYGLTVYLEPGEAVALNAGFLVTEVLDVVENGKPVLILDASAACHMPDVLEMPYRPPLKNSGGITARSAAPITTTGVYTLAKRVMKFSARAFLALEFSIRFSILATVDSPKALVTCTRRAPLWLMQPLITSSPGSTSRGSDSPVSAAVSTVLRPSRTTPSSGIRSPGLITMTSPMATSSGST